MANIKVSLLLPVVDGQPVTFKAPCNCSQVTGIKVEYPNGEDTAFQVFSFADAHGNDLTGIGNLFAEGAMVKVVLDTTANKAFIQNADTNAYLENEFLKRRGGTMTGNIDFEGSQYLSWTTDDGTIIHMRPWGPTNVFQLTMQNPKTGVEEYGPLAIYTDGRVELQKSLHAHGDLTIGGNATIAGLVDLQWLNYRNITGFKALNGVRMCGFRFDTYDYYDIPLPAQESGEAVRWSALVCVTSVGGATSLYYLAGQSKYNINVQHKICGTEGHGVSFAISATDGFLSVYCGSDWSNGWYIVNSDHGDLNVGG